MVSGTSWITGANEAGKHVFGLVAGRDFGWDGVIEAVEVREGDEAPDGSGPLEAARGIEMGHIFQLGRKYAEALDLKVLDQNGKLAGGDHGLLRRRRDPRRRRPGRVQPRRQGPGLAARRGPGRRPRGGRRPRRGDLRRRRKSSPLDLAAAGLEVIYDDRPKVSPGVKFGDAELVGVPTILAVGRGLVDGVVEIKDRASGKAENVALEKAVDYVVNAVRNS